MKLDLVRAVGVAISCLALAAVAAAADAPLSGKYKPAFEVKLSTDTSTVAAYLRAYRSPTPELATQRWESFLSDFSYSDSIEDVTDLTLIRQAHLELMRLYYQKGRVKEADQLLKAASDYAVYSMPEPNASG